MKENGRARLLGAGCLLTCALLFAACHGAPKGRRGAEGNTPPVPTVTAHPGSIHPSLTVAGIIAPFQNVQLTNSLNEPASEVNVNEGDRVHRGEVIAVLDTSDLQAQYQSLIHAAASNSHKATQAVYTAQQTIEQAPNTVQTAREAAAQAESNLRQAQSDLAIDKALESQGYLSQQALRTQQTLTNVYQATLRSNQAALQSAIIAQQTNGTMEQGLQAAQVASAREDAASAQAQADQIAAEIARGTIVSPIDGVVVNRNLNPGEYPGSRTIFVLQQVDPVYAELNASSADVFKVHTGAAVAVSVTGETGASYRGRVVGVLGQVEPGSTNFTVKVLVAGTQGRLAAGLPVSGRVDLPSASGIAIPTAAFLDDSHTSVMIDKNDTATLLHAREVASDGTTSIVTGVPAGTVVISNGQLGIAAGEDLGGP
ncbi:MAG: efflux RND transporter periplasmic adaptor subunit [Candidatus Eremiobacteraeota bacterium]|nr:efflux RND transporter periplasmic adaptor subunit [Candidatus Eremiobacteraeota bacterium]